VYFLNTQKLSQGTRLAKGGERQDYRPFWEVINETSKLSPTTFWLIVDEAHRGSIVTSTDERGAESIMQKFVLGDEGVTGLRAVPLVLGVSATPDRFGRVLSAQNTRTQRPRAIEPSAVRASELLKDKIEVAAGTKADWILLTEAAERFRDYEAAWARYEKDVQPVFVVQVSDGESDKNLGLAVDHIRSVLHGIEDVSFAHSFEKHYPRKVETAGGKMAAVKRKAGYPMQTLQRLNRPTTETS